MIEKGRFTDQEKMEAALKFELLTKQTELVGINNGNHSQKTRMLIV